MKIIGQGKSSPGFGVLGICLSALGMALGLNWDSIIGFLLQKIITLRPDSEIFEFWKTPPASIEIDMYIFNWTNSEDFYNLSTKPRLEQLGPYRFIEKSDKFDIHWHPENASVSYSKRSYYYFDEKGSRGKLSDEIVTLNLVSVTAASKVNDKVNTWSFLRRKMATLALNMHVDSVVLKTTVDKLLFKGNRDILMNVANAMPLLLNEIMPFDRFGYCYQRNGSADIWGKYNIHTGADDFSKIGKIHTWNYKERTGTFDSGCGMMNGTPGELQQPNLKVNDSVSYFVSDFCRSIPLDYVDQSEMNGIPYFKFIGGLRAVDNGTLYPENKCFCAHGKCVPSGLMNIAPCWFNTPLYISYPHFYNADPYYLNAVEGLEPKKEIHELYALLEPRTGFTLDITARLQLNALVEPLPDFRLFKNVPRVFFPVMWIEEKVRMPNEVMSRLKLIPKLLIGGHVLGAIILLVGLVIVACHLTARFSKAAHFVNFISVHELQSCCIEDEKQLQKKICVDGFPLLDIKLKVQSISVDHLDTDLYSSSSSTEFLSTDPSRCVNDTEE